MPTRDFTTEELESEEWKSVVGYFAGVYSVSSLGRVRRDTPCQGTRAGNILRPAVGTDGYLFVRLNFHQQFRQYVVHRLVTRAFIGPPPERHNVNHVDGIKTNNRLSNLEYVTFSRNSKHAFEIGLSPQGEDHGISKLTNQQVREIKQALSTAKHGDQAKLARQYKVNDTVISKIKRGEIWRHIKL